jgi:hypothetical protein
LFNKTYIGKNVTQLQWKILNGRNNRNKIGKVTSDIEESNTIQHLSHSYSDKLLTNLPWLLIKQERNIVKDLIWKIEFPTSFDLNIHLKEEL